jgi:RNA polymerase sigma factor (sigma-70 family)
VPAATLTDRPPIRLLRSKRLLAFAGDERLVEQIRRGNELAFEVAFERHGTGILAFCRHMLGSREEAEDVVQHTFAAAFRDLQRESDRRIALKAWLYTIARNRCVSVLRARREHPSELQELPTDGLSEQVERRAELRELLSDVRELPEEQRAALLLAEAAGLSHAEVAQVLGCEVAGVKGLVFRARSALIERRAARETPCEEIREQLSTLRGGALRRNELRHHLRDCPGCTAYRAEVRRQRQMLAAALPVAPSLGLKTSVLGAAGLGGTAVGGASAGGLALGSAAVAKVALVGVLAGTSVVAGEVVVNRAAEQEPARVAPAPGDARHDAGTPAPARRPAATETRGAHGERISGERSHGQRGAERRAARSQGHGYAGSKPKRPKPERTSSAGGRKLGHEKRAERTAAAPRALGRGQKDAARGQAKRATPSKPVAQSKPTPPRATPPQANRQGTAPAPALPAPAPEAVPDIASPGKLKQSK